MRLSLFVTAAFVMLLGSSTFAHGQKQTERYVPLGQSPGLSGKTTTIGKIGRTDPARRTVDVAAENRSFTVTLSERTRIWLDRSQLKQTALVGSYADLKVGRRIEVKYEDPDRKQLAEWIKVEVIEPGAAPEPTRTP